MKNSYPQIRRLRPAAVWTLVAALAAAVAPAPIPTAAEPVLAAAEPVLTQTAQVADGPAGEGSPGHPIPVNVHDQIDYTLTVDIPPAAVGRPSYDVLFVLDWSDSLEWGYEWEDRQADKDNHQTARWRAGDTIRGLSLWMSQNYPDSRIALMALSSNARNSSDPADTYIQIDTDFVWAEAMGGVIDAAFDEAPDLLFDDVSVFMRAGNDKLAGASTTYGGSQPKQPGYGSPPVRTVKPRTDRSRIPVMVVMSDFQIGLGDFPHPPVAGGDWATVNAQAEVFRQNFPDGVLLGLRMDPAVERDEFPALITSRTHDEKMYDTFDPIGEPVRAWGWAQFKPGQTPSKHESVLRDLIQAKAPPPVYSGVLVDLLPAGLMYIRTEPGVYLENVDGRDQLSWRYPSLRPGRITVRFRAYVIGEGIFDNRVELRLTGQFPATFSSNTTYHRTGLEPVGPSLHLRQIVVERSLSPVQLPSAGHLQVADLGVPHHITTNSGVHQVGQTDFTDHALTDGDDPIHNLSVVVPQYYDYVGYVVTTTSADHDPADIQHGLIALDYGREREYWLTIYLRPAAVTLGEYSWDVHHNDFGMIA
ncbi:MAG: hypothetical protein LBK42_04840 [Propionibacteriaceae bacterium]|jgi:hypothetical protein|nr:hypothetical protein [Propionibacteriaceae bacterium]